MATLDMPFGIPTMTSPTVQREQSALQVAKKNETRLGIPGSGPSVILIAAYFLTLASVAVIAVGGHFPWFTVAPATVLTLIAYFRHVEAKLDRESTG